jgi:hypothetical protein
MQLDSPHPDYERFAVSVKDCRECGRPETWHVNEQDETQPPSCERAEVYAIYLLDRAATHDERFE